MVDLRSHQSRGLAADCGRKRRRKSKWKEILVVVRNADALVIILNVATQDEDLARAFNGIEKPGILLNRKNLISYRNHIPVNIHRKKNFENPHEQFVSFENNGMHKLKSFCKNPTLETATEALTKPQNKRTMIVYNKGRPTKEWKQESATHCMGCDTPRPNEMDKLFSADKVYVYTKTRTGCIHDTLSCAAGCIRTDVGRSCTKILCKTSSMPNLGQCQVRRTAAKIMVQNGDIVSSTGNKFKYLKQSVGHGHSKTFSSGKGRVRTLRTQRRARRKDSDLKW